MNRRITITIDENISDEDAIYAVLRIIKGGKQVENGNFYYSSVVATENGDKVTVYTNLKTTPPNISFKVVYES